jgi:hypothetical protein
MRSKQTLSPIKRFLMKVDFILGLKALTKASEGEQTRA